MNEEALDAIATRLLRSDRVYLAETLQMLVATSLALGSPINAALIKKILRKKGQARKEPLEKGPPGAWHLSSS